MSFRESKRIGSRVLFLHCFCFDDAYLPLSRVGGLEDWTLLQEEGVLLITSFGLPATLSHLSFGKKYTKHKKLSKKKRPKLGIPLSHC